MPVHYRYSGDKEAGIAIKRTVDRELDKHLDNTRLGNLEQNRSVTTFVDGTTIECKSIFNNHLVNVFVPVGGGKREEEKVEYETVEDWVMLLGMVDSNWKLLGVMIVDQTFTVLQFIKNDGSENFDGFKNWNRYYGFKTTWGNKDSGGYFELEELERRSEVGMVYYTDDSTYDYTATFTNLKPGMWGAAYPDSSPYSYLIPGLYGPNLGGGYWLPISEGVTTWYAFWDTAVAVYDWPWDASWWSILNYHWQTEDHGVVTGEGYVYEALVWPPDGIQTDTQVRNWIVHDEYYFKSTEDEQSDVLFIYDYSQEHKWISWKEDCWSGNSETNETLNATQDNWIEGTAVCKNPVDCLPNNVLDPFSKWFIYHEGENPRSASKKYTPWEYQFVYEFSSNVPDMPSMDLEYSYFIKIEFDDGHEEIIDDNYTDGDYEYEDYGIYNFGKNTIYIGHLACTENRYGDYISQLFYYYNGEFKISEKSILADSYSYFIYADIFNCYSKYGGYWNTQVRVAKLRTTRRKQ
jgi:hypothetical protein